eukprot:c5536_g1_i1 orf=29-208(+)
MDSVELFFKRGVISASCRCLTPSRTNNVQCRGFAKRHIYAKVFVTYTKEIICGKGNCEE